MHVAYLQRVCYSMVYYCQSTAIVVFKKKLILLLTLFWLSAFYSCLLFPTDCSNKHLLASVLALKKNHAELIKEHAGWKKNSRKKVKFTCTAHVLQVKIVCNDIHGQYIFFFLTSSVKLGL